MQNQKGVKHVLKNLFEDAHLLEKINANEA